MVVLHWTPADLTSQGIIDGMRLVTDMSMHVPCLHCSLHLMSSQGHCSGTNDIQGKPARPIHLLWPLNSRAAMYLILCCNGISPIYVKNPTKGSAATEV